MKRLTNNNWTDEMHKDIAFFYPYLQTKMTAVVLNKKHKTNLTTLSIERKAKRLKLIKDFSDCITTNDLSEILEIDKKQIPRFIKKAAIKPEKRSSGFYVVSFKDANKMIDMFYIPKQYRISANSAAERFNYEKSSIYYIANKYNLKKIVSGEKKKQSFFDLRELESAIKNHTEQIPFQKPNDDIHIDESISEYYSLGAVCEYIGIDRRVLKRAVGGDWRIFDENIKVKEVKNRVNPDVFIPMSSVVKIINFLYNKGYFNGKKIYSKIRINNSKRNHYPGM